MRVLVIGRGGREHAIVWKLRQSPRLEHIYCAPGNAGIAMLADCIDIAENDFPAIADFSVENRIDLVVVGPEDPLFGGITDFLEKRGIRVFGPSGEAAAIEGSKAFAKRLMRTYNIPTAAYEAFERYEDALAYVRLHGAPIVIKADGLAAGKGVTVAMSLEEAEDALRAMMVERQFGEAGDRVVVEEFLQGEEMSILSFVDGETVRPMVPAQDHKPVYDGDKGPNTGGMGTYSPVPHLPEADVEEAIRTIIEPAAKAMVQEGKPFRGVLFTGLMMTANGPKTIEFNCRFGDPETQVVLARLESDLLDAMEATVDGTLADADIRWSGEAAVCVVMASGGYPGAYEKGLPIEGLDDVRDSVVIHAGTAMKDGQVVTAGGRVLGVVATGGTLAVARRKAYGDVERIHFTGKHARSDIGLKALRAAGIDH